MDNQALDICFINKQIVHKKTASVLCLTSVKNEDKLEFSKVLEAVKVTSIMKNKSNAYDVCVVYWMKWPFSFDSLDSAICYLFLEFLFSLQISVLFPLIAG